MEYFAKKRMSFRIVPIIEALHRSFIPVRICVMISSGNVLSGNMARILAPPPVYYSSRRMGDGPQALLPLKAVCRRGMEDRKKEPEDPRLAPSEWGKTRRGMEPTTLSPTTGDAGARGRSRAYW